MIYLLKDAPKMIGRALVNPFDAICSKSLRPNVRN